MRDRSQSVFTVEGLQPDWLGRSSLVVVYVLISRFVWVLALTLSLQLAAAVPYVPRTIGPLVLWTELSPSQLLLSTLIVATLVFVPVMFTNLIHIALARRFGGNRRTLPLAVGLFTITAFLCVSRIPTSFLSLVSYEDYAEAHEIRVFRAVIFVVILGPVLAWQVGRRTLNSDVRTGESFYWSGRVVLVRLLAVLRWPWLWFKRLWSTYPAIEARSALVLIFLVMETGFLSVLVQLGVIVWFPIYDSQISFVLPAESVLILCIGTSLGIRTELPALTVKANGGVVRALTRACVFGSVVAATNILLLALSSVRIPDAEKYNSLSPAAVLFGYGFALCSALVLGGIDAINHYTLRLLLYASARLPLRIVRFLDYAANDLQILQKVGGGYIFVHRYLLEHFAEMNDARRAA
jgi:hypothetical protein